MGSSAPAAIDYVDSHARLRGGDVEVVLSGLAQDIGDRTALVLSTGRLDHLRACPGAGDGRHLARCVRVRRAKVARATATGRSPSPARRVRHGRRPPARPGSTARVVLVLGATAPPRASCPQPADGVVPTRCTLRQRAAAVAEVRMLDGALRVLPAERAARGAASGRAASARSVLR